MARWDRSRSKGQFADESSSRFVALCLVLHLSSSCMSSASLSGGRLISCFTESRMRPRYDTAVRGPSTFSMATGTPSLEATWRNVSRSRWQQKECGGAARKKIVEVVDEVTQLEVMAHDPLHCHCVLIK